MAPTQSSAAGSGAGRYVQFFTADASIGFSAWVLWALTKGAKT